MPSWMGERRGLRSIAALGSNHSVIHFNNQLNPCFGFPGGDAGQRGGGGGLCCYACSAVCKDTMVAIKNRVYKPFLETTKKQKQKEHGFFWGNRDSRRKTLRTPCPKCRAKPSSVQAAAPRCNLISSSPTLLVLRIYCTIVVSCCIPQGKHEGRCPLARACLLRTTVVLRLFLYVHLSGDNSLRRLFFRAGDLFFFFSGMVVFGI